MNLCTFHPTLQKVFLVRKCLIKKHSYKAGQSWMSNANYCRIMCILFFFLFFLKGQKSNTHTTSMVGAPMRHKEGDMSLCRLDHLSSL